MSSRLPPWFKQKIPDPAVMSGMKDIITGLNLNTVCEHAVCPNIGECFKRKTATFMIMGSVCTRNCTFCAVKKGIPAPLDNEEPRNVAEAAARMGLRHAVLTSVTRDDLIDGGASHFALTISELRNRNARSTIEVLVPDFNASSSALRTVVSARPDVLNHNLETVERLYSAVRPQANYQRSLQLLADVKKLDLHIITKSGLMVGLGETRTELQHTLEDLRSAGCDLLTIGQYLQPSHAHYPVKRYVTPAEFQEYETSALSMGFACVACAPLVRSSYKADQLYQIATDKIGASACK